MWVVIGKILDVNLIGMMNGCQVALNNMLIQGYGHIYTMEGYGSNDAVSVGLSLYGTTKRAVTYFTEALANEAEKLNTGV